MIGAVLLQKSEGGGLGMGGGAGFMSSRGTANLLTRTTAILAVGFFLTSLFLSWYPGYDRKPSLDHRRAGVADPAGRRRDTDHAADLGRHPGFAEEGRRAAAEPAAPAARRCRVRNKAGGPCRAAATVLHQNPHQGSVTTLSFGSPTGPQIICAADYEFALANRFEGLKVKSHGAVHIHHRRRGLFAWQRSGFSGTRCPVASPGLQGPPPQARPLSQPRSRNDVAVSARRSVRDR